MRGREFRLIGGLLVILAATSPAQAASTPEETVWGLYGVVVTQQVSGLPDARQMQLLRTYLSADLRRLFARAARQQEEFSRRHPDEKPPWVEGCLFSCSFEGPQRFIVGRPLRAGRFVRVPVTQWVGQADEVPWTDTVVLTREQERWVVWDIRMGCDWPFHMGPTLRGMLSSGP